MRIVETDTMDTRVNDRLTADEFLEWIAGPSAPEGRWELIAGVPMRMMVNVRRRHSTIVGNLLAALHAQLRGGQCRPHAEAFALRVSNDQVRFPDLLIDCAPGHGSDLAATEPRAVIEVLSDGTRTFDTSRKLEEYQGVPAIQHIVFIEAGLVDVNHFARDSDGWKRVDLNQFADVLDLSAVGAGVTLKDIYEDSGVPAPGPRLRVLRDE